jgi:hypothetical protein
MLSCVLLSCDATTTVSFFGRGGAETDSAGGSAESGAAGATMPVGEGGESAGSAEGLGGTTDTGGPWVVDVPSPAVLVHRYDFSGTDTNVVDLVADASGTVQGGTLLTGDGTLTLDGEDDYVVLPGGLVSSLGSVSIVTWFTWAGVMPWERVFDFGATAEGAGVPGTAIATLFFTPLFLSGPGSSAHFEVSEDGAAGRTAMIAANSEAALPTGLMHQIVVVFDGSVRALRLYIDGTQKAETSGGPPLSALRDENCWLGQSMWEQDAHTHGIYDEFRIYQGVLSVEEIQSLLTAGPDRP